MEFEKVRNIIAEQFSIGADKITEETSFLKDLNADSLDVFQLITAIEEEFDIELQGDDVDKITTVGDVVSSLKKYVK